MIDLRSATGRGVCVAIVDSGVHVGHPHLARPDRPRPAGVSESVEAADSPSITGFGVERCSKGCAHVRPDYTDRHGHGTACAAVVRWGAPDAGILAVRVLDAELGTTTEELARSLEEIGRRPWRSPETRPRVVNLSLGAVRPEAWERLGPLTDRLLEAGILVIGAARADEEPSWPAHHPGVLSVTADHTLPPWGYRVERSGASLRIVASPFPRPIGTNPPERNFAGTSFAAPRVAALLARAIEVDPTLEREGLLEVLEANAATFGRAAS